MSEVLNELLQEERAEGREEGRSEGRIEGEVKKMTEIAKAMLLRGELSLEDISMYTGLNQQQVRELQYI